MDPITSLYASERGQLTHQTPFCFYSPILIPRCNSQNVLFPHLPLNVFIVIDEISILFIGYIIGSLMVKTAILKIKSFWYIFRHGQELMTTHRSKNLNSYEFVFINICYKQRKGLENLCGNHSSPYIRDSYDRSFIYFLKCPLGQRSTGRYRTQEADALRNDLLYY